MAPAESNVRKLPEPATPPMRMAPQNIEAEQALLGAMLINNDAFYRVSDFLEPEHFAEGLHQQIFEVASKLIRAGKTASPITLKTFSNGEVYCRFEESIRGADVFLIQPTCGNPVTGVSANDALFELLAMIDAAVGASAHRVIAVTPWFGYSRQDKKSAPREPISARLIARCLEAAGADRVLTMDLHAGQVQGFFNIPVDHMTAMMMLTQYFQDLGLSDLVVVAPATSQ